MTERGWRGSADLWRSAAYGALVEGGPEAAKAMPMARCPGLSRPSFCWHFSDREALLATLVADRRAGNTAVPAATVTEAVLPVSDRWVDRRCSTAGWNLRSASGR
jgi:hypothetical protein